MHTYSDVNHTPKKINLPATSLFLDSTKDHVLIRLNEVVENRFHDFDLSSGNLHRLVPTSRATLHRKLSRAFGICASEYLNNYRVFRSLDYFPSLRYSITDIAMLVGMSSSAFSRAFKTFVGQTPNDYRLKCLAAAYDSEKDGNAAIFETIGKGC